MPKYLLRKVQHDTWRQGAPLCLPLDIFRFQVEGDFSSMLMIKEKKRVGGGGGKSLLT